MEASRAEFAGAIIESVEPPVLVVIGERTALRRILLCTGGTKQSDATVNFAGEIARRANASITLLHVLAEPPAMYVNLIKSEEDLDKLLQSDSKLGRNLRHQKELLEKLGVPCEVRLDPRNMASSSMNCSRNCGAPSTTSSSPVPLPPTIDCAPTSWATSPAKSSTAPNCPCSSSAAE